MKFDSQKPWAALTISAALLSGATLPGCAKYARPTDPEIAAIADRDIGNGIFIIHSAPSDIVVKTLDVIFDRYVGHKLIGLERTQDGRNEFVLVLDKDQSGASYKAMAVESDNSCIPEIQAIYKEDPRLKLHTMDLLSNGGLFGSYKYILIFEVGEAPK